ncbi:MAG: arginine repressor [Lachnospiraceae bacterium]|nr:arginine repressor [Lachnospiraceae bacterium]
MKIERHKKILELINEYDVETQEELADLLNKSGYNVTQATVSRDIRQMKLFKQNIKGKLKYVVLNTDITDMNDKFIRILKDGFISMAMAQNILVIKTVPGMAMAVAASLDAMNWNEVVGSIAGDDTVMCAIASVDETLIVMNKLRKLLDK